MFPCECVSLPACVCVCKGERVGEILYALSVVNKSIFCAKDMEKCVVFIFCFFTLCTYLLRKCHCFFFLL